MKPYTQSELIPFIEAAGESPNVDAKRPMQWDGHEVSAGLTKDILAFANTRDGGVLVIGKSEIGTNKFELTGLSTTEAESFDTTKIATWVNNHCEPPITVVCYRVEHGGKEFAVVTVAEFHDVPVICTKQFQLDGKPPKVLLRKGEIYVRTPNVASAPLTSVEELRTLVGIATTKQADKMLSMFQAMMKGRSLIEAKPSEELFQGEREEVRSALDRELDGHIEDGAWIFTCHPLNHVQDRWEETSQLKRLLETSIVSIRRTFPPHDYRTHSIDWGIWNQKLEDAFGITRSGFFMAVRLFRENTFPFRDSEIPVGEWLDFKLNLGSLIEFFLFLSRFGQNFAIGEELVIEIVAEPIFGRRLVTMDRNIYLDPSEPCRATRFRYMKVVSVETLRAGWEDLCLKALSRFCELFNGPDISDDTLRDWVTKFKERRVD